MKDLLEHIDAYYEDYIERLDETQTPLSKEDYIRRICGQLEECVWDEVKYLAENQEEE